MQKEDFPKDHVERLWAPWRVEYFETIDRNPDFLLEAANSEDDAAHLVVARNDGAVLMLNKYPYAAGHLMAAPRRKVSSLEGLSEREKLDLLELVELAQRLLAEVVKARGFNIGMNIGACAGAGAPDHLHIHIVPRWPGDVNFVTVLGGVRVIPEGLEPVWRRLRAALERMRGSSDGAAG